jgi:HSP20 family protein
MTENKSSSSDPAGGDDRTTSSAESQAGAREGGTVRPERHWPALRQEMDRLFDDFFSGTPFAMLRRRQIDADPWRRLQAMFDATSPVVDVAEGETDYRITAELPGMTEADVEITVTNGMLSIKGEKKQEARQEKEDRVISERRYGSFQRSFPIPDDADIDKIDASMRNGLLAVTLPKRPDAPSRRRKVEVKPA